MRTSSLTLWLALPVLWAGPVLAQGDNPNPQPQQPPAGMPPGVAPPHGEKMPEGVPAGSVEKLDKADRKFFDLAVSSNMLEIELGRLATEKGTSPEVKDYAKKVVEDHTKVNEDLRRIAGMKGIEFPTQMSREDRKIYDKLAGITGEKFDKEYMKTSVKTHDSNVKLFQKEVKSGKDPDLKEFATRTLPSLMEHRDTAQRDVKRM